MGGSWGKQRLLPEGSWSGDDFISLLGLHVTAAIACMLWVGGVCYTQSQLWPVIQAGLMASVSPVLQVKNGLKTWSKLHLVRTVASIASFGLATLSLAASHKADPQPVSY